MAEDGYFFSMFQNTGIGLLTMITESPLRRPGVVTLMTAALAQSADLLQAEFRLARVELAEKLAALRSGLVMMAIGAILLIVALGMTNRRKRSPEAARASASATLPVIPAAPPGDAGPPRRPTRARLQTCFLRRLAESGSVAEAAARVGITPRTVQRWRALNAAFARRYEEVLSQRLEILEDLAMRRALSADCRPVFHRGEQIASVERHNDAMWPIGWRASRNALPCSRPTICHRGSKIGVSTPPGCTELQRMSYFCSAQ